MKDSEQDPEIMDEEETENQDECEPEPAAQAPQKPEAATVGSVVHHDRPVAKPAITPVRHVYPFNVRYAAEILDLAGFVDGQSYTGDEIKDLLVQNGFTEFQDLSPSFHLSSATNTLVITIQGSKKGTGLSQALQTLAESTFRDTFDRLGTEDRLLVYRTAQSGILHLVSPRMSRTPGSVMCDIPLSVERNGETWDLAYDLHSHHVMGAFWSRTDDLNERIRGPVFGVFSWKDDVPTWLFRRFNGSEYEDLPAERVVAWV